MQTRKTSSKNVLTHYLSEPLCGATTARFDIHAGDGNVTIDRLNGSEQVLASGTLEYLENQDLPTTNLITDNGEAALTLRGSVRPQRWIRLPWAACNGATEWQIHLNPGVSSDLIVHSNGGNIKLYLAGMTLTSLSADTGGGNIEVILPGDSIDLNVVLRTGAGNVAIQLPSSIEAQIHATTGLGKVVMDPKFSKVADKTYQSAGYDRATYKVEITASSGAGNVIVGQETA